MKSLIIALIFGIGVSGLAQVHTPQPDDNGIEKLTPEQRQQKHLAHLTKELNLDDKQQKKVGKLLAEKSAKAQELHTQKDIQKVKGNKMTPEEKTAFKNKMEAEKADTDARMKKILSVEQYQKWLTVREENKGKMKGRKGAMGKATPEEFQKKHLDHLTKELTLDSKQQEAVGKVLAEKSAKLQEFKAKKDTEKSKGNKLTPEEKTVMKNKMEAEKLDTETRMKAILSADQYKKWLAIREENKVKMKEKGRHGMENVSPEQHLQKHLTHLTKDLNLDAKQQEAVGKILAEKSAKVQELKTKKDTEKSKGNKLTPEEKTALKNKMEAENLDTETRMKAILSADQYKKWLAIREEHKGKMKEKRRQL